VLRTDDWNAKRGGDIEAAQKTRALIKKTPIAPRSQRLDNMTKDAANLLF
jgi:hypothetical protein